jgi:ketosteroid isomerase-like protein
MVAGYGEVMNAWEDYAGKLEGYRELADGRVLVLIQLSGHGKTSGLELREVRPKAAGIFEVTNGKVTELVLYWDRQRAFAELGVQPEDEFSSP